MEKTTVIIKYRLPDNTERVSVQTFSGLDSALLFADSIRLYHAPGITGSVTVRSENGRGIVIGF